VRQLILGLGNPGEPYRDTRHNAGFRVVDELARRWGVRLDRLECNALVGTAAAPGGEVSEVSEISTEPTRPPGAGETLLAKPQTYMNRSGYAARCLLERHALEPSEILVVYDEVALPLGRLRLRPSGSPAGHRGVESVIENLRTDQVPRLRLGIAGTAPPAGDRLADFVLSPFDPGEMATVDEMIGRAADACELWRRAGAAAAMNRFNG
jgi:PTH1 family peptidyl-tRNA hydrolase